MRSFFSFIWITLKKIDYYLLALVLTAGFYGVLLILSATNSFGTLKPVIMQAGALVVGLFAILVLLIIDYKNLSKFSIYIYGVCILLLVATLIFGKEVQGNKNWLEFGPISIQPSEFVKIGFIITFATHINKVKYYINSLRALIPLLIHFSVILVLVLLEGDLGTSLVFLFICILMLFAAGLHWLYFASGAVIVTAAAPFVFENLLNNYQQMRILAVYDPSLDPLGYGYHTLQSKITLGSGGLTGSGLFNGVQTQYGILPAKQTDFIFSVAGEELGFIGTLLIIVLEVLIIIRIFYIARHARDDMGTLICVGAASGLLFQAAENIGMCLGLLPVIGITLPFFSYGGSSMLASMCLIGVVMSVNSDRKGGFFKK